MRKALVGMAVVAMALLAGRVFADDSSAGSSPAASNSNDMHQGMNMNSASPAGKSMKCEVIDVACYIQKGAHGEAHQACAAKCISGGGELALLYNGKLYIPVDKDYHSARDQFVTKGGEMVTVTGTTVSKSGLNYMIVSEPAPAASANTTSAN